MSKPRWDYRRQGRWVPDMSSTLQNNITALLGDNEATTRFLNAVHTHLHVYTINKEDESCNPDGHPTPAEMKAAAKILMRDASKLFAKLQYEVSGLRPHLDYYIMKEMEHIKRHFWVQDLEMALEALMKGCQQFIVKDYPNMGSNGVTSEKVFAYRVASLFREILEEEPQKYIPEDLSITLPKEQRKGKFARVLSACFIDAIGYSPGNLKEIAYWGIDFVPKSK